MRKRSLSNLTKVRRFISRFAGVTSKLLSLDITAWKKEADCYKLGRLSITSIEWKWEAGSR